MEKHKKVIIWVSVAVLIIIGTFVTFYLIGKNSTPAPKGNPLDSLHTNASDMTASVVVGAAGTSDPVDPARKLKMGDTGNTVIALQTQLNEGVLPPILPLSQNGIYDNSTDFLVQNQMAGMYYNPQVGVSVNDIAFAQSRRG